MPDLQSEPTGGRRPRTKDGSEVLRVHLVDLGLAGNGHKEVDHQLHKLVPLLRHKGEQVAVGPDPGFRVGDLRRLGRVWARREVMM